MGVGVSFSYNTAYAGHEGIVVKTSQGEFEAEKVINCAGLYADKIAQDFGEIAAGLGLDRE